MNLDDAQKKLAAKFPSAILERVEAKPDAYLKVDPAQIHDVLRYLRDELKFETLSDLCGVDHLKEGLLAVVYHPFSYTHKLMLSLKVFLPRTGEPKLRSVADLYKAANWLERETYDLLGVRFEGHPDHRRILCPEDWEGYPLRKDYTVPDFYNGMPVPLFFENDEQAPAGATHGEQAK